jgi:hypothetical protein
MRRSGKLLAACVLLAGCTTSGPPSAEDASPSLPSDDYGLTRTPDGERQYLARLICPSGEHPDFARVGSVGPRTAIPTNMSQAAKEKLLGANLGMEPLAAGEPDHHWIDAYEVRCGAQTTTIYMDMYHCSAVRPSDAPAGFGIAP